MKRHLCLFLSSSAIALLSTLSGFCQSAAHDATPAGKLRFAVVVSDAHGAPIRDLHSDEFTIEVGSKPQPVQVVPPAAPVPRTTVGGANDGRGLVVVVIDTIHTAWEEENDLRLNAGKYLAACARQDVPVSLLVLRHDGALSPVHEYTTSSATLTAALGKADAELHHHGLTAGASPDVVAEASRFVDFYKGTGNFPSPRVSKAYPGVVLDGIRIVAGYVAGIPGRKSLVWISSYVPFAVDEKRGRIASPTQRAGDVEEAIYPYLLTQDQINELQTIWKESLAAAQRSELALFPALSRGAATGIDPNVVHSMESLAHMTGGQEVHSVGDVFAQFQNLAESNATAYEVVLPSESTRNCNTDWCPMRITVNRPGARVLAPQGFFRDTSIVRETPAAVAQTSDEPGSGPNAIPFTVTWKPAEDAGARKKISFAVAFGPGAGIPATGSAELNVEIMVHAFSGETDAQGVSFGANTKLTPSTLDEIRNKGFVLNNAIELPPGEYSVRFVVHDKVSGRLGVLKVPLKVG